MAWKDLLFPKKCVGCGKLGSFVCEDCFVGMWEEEQICPGCRRASRYGLRHVNCKSPLEGLTCLWSYEGITRKLISKIKYYGYYDYLGQLVMSDGLWAAPEFFYFNKFLQLNPVVVPIPLHKNRLRQRGFNQAEMISKLVARSWMLDTRNLLERIKDTKQQVGRDRNERLNAMENAFSIKNRTMTNVKSILLVDDVWTTGATMTSAARTLKKAGVEMIWGVVLAR